MYKMNNLSPDDYQSYTRESQKLLIRLFAFIFFTFIIALISVHKFAEHGRILIMVIVMFPLVLALSGIVIGLTISNYKTGRKLRSFILIKYQKR